MTTAAIYIRKSREDKDKPAYRLAVQRQQLPAYAQAQGWNSFIYDDGHASAARGKTEDLQERGRLEKDLRSGKINIILTIELSRLSRDHTLEDYLAWLNLCADHGVQLATMSRTLDPKQHSDWMLLLMEGGFSSVEMKVLRERMKEGRQQAHRAGKWLGGTPPPPYVYDKGTGEIGIDEERLAECRQVWSIAETHSAKTIAQALEKPEITIRRMLSDDRLLFYQGLRLTETGEIVEGQWPAIMDAAQANRIRVARRTRKTNGIKKEAAALLSNLGMLYCGYCGRTVKTWRNSRIRKDGNRLNYYGCQTKSAAGACEKSRLIPQPILEDRILTSLFNTLGRLDDLVEYWTLNQTGDITRELANIDSEEAVLQESKERLVAAIAQGVIEFADAKKQREEINARIEAVKEKRVELLASRQDPPDWDALNISRDSFDQAPENEKRQFLRTAIAEARIFNSYALITYAFPREANGNRTARIHLPPSRKGQNSSKVYKL